MAKKAKLGRNDPCPCGSGKKYKHCCGQNTDSISVYSNPFQQYGQEITAAKIKLDRHFTSDVKKHRKDLQHRFIRLAAGNKLPSDHEAIFSDWLWFDVTDEGGKSMAASYLNENESYMEASLRECLQRLDESFLSVFQVTGAGGDRIQVTDIFLENSSEILIGEPLLLNPDDPELILLARQLDLGKVSLFSGQVLSLYNTTGQKDWIVKHFDYIQKVLSMERIPLLKSSAEIIYGLFDHALQQQALDLNDMRSASLSKEEKSTLMGALAADSSYKLSHSSADLSWYEPVKEAAGYSRILVGDDLVVSCADRLEDILQQEQTLQTILPEIDIRIISAQLLDTAPDMEFISIWYTILKDKEYEKWLLTPHQELDSKTPQELIGTSEGKKQILGVLSRFRDTRDDDQQRELIDYMIERVTGLSVSGD